MPILACRKQIVFYSSDCLHANVLTQNFAAPPSYRLKMTLIALSCFLSRLDWKTHKCSDILSVVSIFLQLVQGFLQDISGGIESVSSYPLQQPSIQASNCSLFRDGWRNRTFSCLAHQNTICTNSLAVVITLHE